MHAWNKPKSLIPVFCKHFTDQQQSSINFSRFSLHEVFARKSSSVLQQKKFQHLYSLKPWAIIKSSEEDPNHFLIFVSHATMLPSLQEAFLSLLICFTFRSLVARNQRKKLFGLEKDFKINKSWRRETFIFIFTSIFFGVSRIYFKGIQPWVIYMFVPLFVVLSSHLKMPTKR